MHGARSHKPSLCLMMIIILTHRAFGTILVIPRVKTETTAQEVIKKWQHVEDFVLETMETVLKHALPIVVRLISEAEVSDSCSASLLSLAIGLKEMRLGAFEMADASGKLPSGIMSGTTDAFGSYDQCLNIHAPDVRGSKVAFSGKYCTVEVRMPLPKKPWFYQAEDILPAFKGFTAKSEVFESIVPLASQFYNQGWRFGICIPSNCSLEDVQKVTTIIADRSGLGIDVPRCELKEEPKFSYDQIVVLFILSILIILTICGSFFDFWKGNTAYKSNCKISAIEPMKRMMVAFSLQRNTSKLFDTSITEDSIAAVHGIKFFSLTWIILGHSYIFINWELLHSILNARKHIKSVAFQVIVNASVCVDTFFFLSGFLVCYAVLKHVEKNGYQSFKPVIFIIRRIWRLLPCTVTIVGTFILVPLMGSGPMWYETVVSQVENCRRNWWAVLIFGNNYVHPSEMCLLHTWYVSVDMQLHIISVVYFLVFIRNNYIGLIVNAIMIIVGIVITGGVTYFKKFPPTMLSKNTDIEQRMELWNQVYFQMFSHLSSYAVGIGFGYIFLKYKKRKLNKAFEIIGWCMAISCSLGVLYGSHAWNRDKAPPPSILESVTYASLHRIGWCLAVAWLLWSCATGRAGIINSLLSWKAFIPLSRLSFLFYLLHVVVILFFIGNLRSGFDTSNLIPVWTFFGHLMIAGGLSYAFYLLVEAPAMELQKIVFSRTSSKQTIHDDNRKETKTSDKYYQNNK